MTFTLSGDLTNLSADRSCSSPIVPEHEYGALARPLDHVKPRSDFDRGSRANKGDTLPMAKWQAPVSRAILGRRLVR
jgi:hypothetical protein